MTWLKVIQRDIVRLRFAVAAISSTPYDSNFGNARLVGNWPRCRRARRQLLQQCLRLLQIKRVEALGEPAVDRSEQIAGLISLALIAPEPRHAHRGAEFPGFCLLRTGDRKCTLEIRFRFRRIWLRRHEREVAGYSMEVRLEPPFIGCFRQSHRFVDAAPSRIVLSQLRMGPRQI